MWTVVLWIIFRLLIGLHDMTLTSPRYPNFILYHFSSCSKSLCQCSRRFLNKTATLAIGLCTWHWWRRSQQGCCFRSSPFEGSFILILQDAENSYSHHYQLLAKGLRVAGGCKFPRTLGLRAYGQSVSNSPRWGHQIRFAGTANWHQKHTEAGGGPLWNEKWEEGVWTVDQ